MILVCFSIRSISWIWSMYAQRCMISSPQHLCVAKHWVTVVEGRFVASQSQVATDRQVCQMLARYTRHGYPVEEMHGPNLGCETPDIICLAQYVLLHLGCHPHLSRLKVCMPRKEPYQAHVSRNYSILSIRYQEVSGFHQVISSHRSKFCIDRSLWCWLHII